MLLNTHASNNRANFDLLLMLVGDDGLDVVFDLNRQLTSWTYDKSLDCFKLVITLAELAQTAKEDVQDGNRKC